MAGIREPSHHLIAIDLQLLHPDAAPDLSTSFDQSSLCVMRETHGLATIATDFSKDVEGKLSRGW